MYQTSLNNQMSSYVEQSEQEIEISSTIKSQSYVRIEIEKYL